MADGIEAALEELYAADPSGFTQKRDALAKELKKAGDKEGAAAVAARRKPTQIAYVLNQIARRHPDAIADLVDVGRELAREQRRALRGEKSYGLRDSIDRQRKAIGEVGKKAAAVMKELGVDPLAHLQEVTMALQAALIDPAVGAALEEGRLEKAPEAAVGFGGPMPTPAESEPAAPKAKARTSEAPARDDLAERRKKKKADEEAEAARKRKSAAHAKSVADAAAVLRAAEAEAEDARTAAETAATEAEAAEIVAKKAREAAAAAAENAKRLAAELPRAERTVVAAKKELTRLEANAPD